MFKSLDFLRTPDSVLDIPRVIFDAVGQTNGQDGKSDLVLTEEAQKRIIARPLFVIGGLALRHSPAYLGKIDTENFRFHATLVLSTWRGDNVEYAQLKLFACLPEEDEMDMWSVCITAERGRRLQESFLQECRVKFGSPVLGPRHALNLNSPVASTAIELSFLARELYRGFPCRLSLPTIPTMETSRPRRSVWDKVVPR